jgi:hypothetical protein
MRFNASLHNVDLDKEIRKKKEIDMSSFQELSAYEHLSVKDRRKLTMEMLGRLKPKLGKL